MNLFEKIPPISEKNIKFFIRRPAEKALRSGHPWLFESAIESQKGDGPPGTLAIVFDHKKKFLAFGLYDPLSPLRLKILQHREPAPWDEEWWSRKIKASLEQRKELFSSPLTNGFRLIHGENDGFPGLVLDKYDETLVVKIYTTAWIPHLKKFVSSLSSILPHIRMVLRLARNCAREKEWLFGLEDGQILYGEALEEPVIFQENGIFFEADLLKGQKTGFFLDQRENRAGVEKISQGKEVLNVFSFSGGFSLYAARGGAKKVTSLDLSSYALESAQRNFLLNPSLLSVPHAIIQAEAFEKLASLASQSMDLVILDPPSFARKEEEIPAALESYSRLNALGARLVRPSGMMVTCSCSSRITAEDFENAVSKGLSNYPFSIWKKTGHPIDHPIGFPEGAYLKALWLRRE